MKLVVLLLFLCTAALARDFRSGTDDYYSDENNNEEVVTEMTVDNIPEVLVFVSSDITTSKPEDESNLVNVTMKSEICSSFIAKEDDDSADEDIVNIAEIVATLATQEGKNETKVDWHSMSPETKNRHLLNSGLYSDCSFVVGTDNLTQIFRGHKSILVSSSPVFESIFCNNVSARARIRITDGVTPQAFKSLLEFVYTGKTCLSSFEAAIDVLSAARTFKIVPLVHHCRAFMWATLYPDNLWRALSYASDVNDTLIMNMAIQNIQSHTELSLKDPAFMNIPLSALVSLLQKDNLNIGSETQLFEASLRWAMAEATRRGRQQNPETLREMLGPAISHIRFLTMNPREFTDLQATTKILTYPESLAIIFNINSPGIIPVPDTLSQNKEYRTSAGSSNLQYFDVLGSPPDICNANTLTYATTNVNSLSLFMDTPVDSSVRTVSINVPTQIQSNEAKSSYHEDFSVYILDGNKNVAYQTRHQKLESYDSIAKVSVNFFIQNGYTIRIIPHTSGRYPSTYTRGTKRSGIMPRQRHTNFGYQLIRNCFYDQYNKWILPDDSFVHSMQGDRCTNPNEECR